MRLKFKNLPLMYQVLIPVGVSITLFIIAIILSGSKLNTAHVNSLHTAELVDYSSHVQETERFIWRLRRVSDAAVSGAIDWDSFHKQKQELDSNIRNDFTHIRSLDFLPNTTEERLQTIEVLLDDFSETLDVIETKTSQANEIYESLGWLHERINRTNIQVMESNQNLEQIDAWEDARAKMFIESTHAQTYLAEMMMIYNENSRANLQTALSDLSQIIGELNNPIVNNHIGYTLENYVSNVSKINDLNRDVYFLREELSDIGSQLRSNVTQLVDNASSNMVASSDSSLELIAETETALYVAVVFSVILSASIGIFCAKQMRTTLMTLQVAMQSVSKGELFNRVESDATNEFGQLCNHVDGTISSLNSTVSELRNVGTEVSSSATELASVMTQLEANSSEQKSQIELVASAITELATSSTQVAASASSADENAKSVMNITQKGVESAETGVKLTEELINELNSTSAVAESLQKLSEDVSSFVSMIENVAEQTNLLALNAAIEAARAGDSGRGFAVVADEVRVLAQRTSDSTGSIQELVSSLQQRAKDMISSVDVCVTKVSNTSDINRATSFQMSTISDEIAHISLNNSEMSSAADEQSRAIASITENIAVIDDAISQSSAGVTQSTEAASYLSELSENQRAQLDYFKLQA